MIFYVCAACSIPVMCASCFVMMRFYLIYVVFTNTDDGPLNLNYPTGDAPDGARYRSETHPMVWYLFQTHPMVWYLFKIKETAMRLTPMGFIFKSKRLTPMGLIQVKMTPMGLHLWCCMYVSLYHVIIVIPLTGSRSLDLGGECKRNSHSSYWCLTLIIYVGQPRYNADVRPPWLLPQGAMSSGRAPTKPEIYLISSSALPLISLVQVRSGLFGLRLLTRTSCCTQWLEQHGN